MAFTQADFVDKNFPDAVAVLKAALPADALMLDLGAGKTPLPGLISVDQIPEADVRCDLFKRRWFKPQYRWPFKTHAVDLLASSHFLEHVPDWDAFWREAYRVVKPGGYVAMVTPYYSSVRATQDPDHKQMISAERYEYLNAAWRKQFQLDHYGAKVDFRRLALLFGIHEDFRQRDMSVVSYAMKHYINVIEDLAVILQKPE